MPTEEKKGLSFKIGIGLNELPERKYRKGSRYDVILTEIEKVKERFIPIEIEGKDANYIRTQLYKRIQANQLKGIGVVVANGKCYIEKDPKITIKK